MMHPKDLEALPSLKAVRVLMPGSPCSYDLARFVHPSWAKRDEAFMIRHPGLIIRFEHGFLFNSTLIGTDAAHASGHYWGCSEGTKGIDYRFCDNSEDPNTEECDRDSDDMSYIPDGSSDGSDCSSSDWSVSDGSSDVPGVDIDMYPPEFSDSASDSIRSWE
jgi:hypothetical protein